MDIEIGCVCASEEEKTVYVVTMMVQHLIPISIRQHSSFRKVKWQASRNPLHCAGYERQRETGSCSASVFIQLCVSTTCDEWGREDCRYCKWHQSSYRETYFSMIVFAGEITGQLALYCVDHERQRETGSCLASIFKVFFRLVPAVFSVILNTD